MSVYTQDFALLTDAEATAVKLIGNDKSGVKLKIRDLYLERTAGTGTQFAVRWYMGWTAAPTHQAIVKATIPSVADTWDNASGGQANSTPDPSKRFSTLYKDFPEGWTDSSTPRAGLGFYMSCAQVAGSSATNAVTVKVDVGK